MLPRVSIIQADSCSYKKMKLGQTAHREGSSGEGHFQSRELGQRDTHLASTAAQDMEPPEHPSPWDHLRQPRRPLHKHSQKQRTTLPRREKPDHGADSRGSRIWDD